MRMVMCLTTIYPHAVGRRVVVVVVGGVMLGMIWTIVVVSGRLGVAVVVLVVLLRPLVLWRGRWLVLRWEGRK